MLLLLPLSAILVSVSAQSFSIGTSIGVGSHGVPQFESQKRASTDQSSSRRGSSSPLTFSQSFSQDFPFSFNDFSPSKVPERPPQRSHSASSTQVSGRTSPGAATSQIIPSPSRSTPREPTSPSRSRDIPVAQVSRGNSFAQPSSRVQTNTRGRARTSDVSTSSRGREQIKAVEPAVTRPHSTTTPVPDVVRLPFFMNTHSIFI